MAQGMVKERNRCRCYLPVFHNAKVTPAHLSTAGFSVDRLIALKLPDHHTHKSSHHNCQQPNPWHQTGHHHWTSETIMLGSDHSSIDVQV
ncbi:unnamed protein product [Clonostachys rhizophaga]|uniref:Uncharacterized protein n=1 Tax=Clonostachys rhizophaga TaxID=160324 RepID=A0A9N9YSW0_9HYPO|nr:unnamed protein product [Clonostachys rhizophaga]